jgi:hypothetical protein
MSIIYPNSVTVNNNITNNITSSTGGTAGGSNGDIQYNSGSSFAASASFTFNTSSNTVTVPNVISNGIRTVSITTGPQPYLSQLITDADGTGSLGPFTSTLWTVAVTGSGTKILRSAEPLITTGSVIGQELWLYNVDGDSTVEIPFDINTCAFSGSVAISLAPGNVVKFILMPGGELPNYWAQVTPIAASY